MIISPKTNQEIEELTLDLYNKYFEEDNFKLLENIIKDNNIQIKMANFRNTYRGNPLFRIACLEIKKEKILWIWDINTRLIENYNIAKQLGHYYLHYESGEETFDIIANKKIERQADLFSESLLMPKEEFIKEYKFNNDLILLAGKFKLPVEVVERRFNYLFDQIPF